MYLWQITYLVDPLEQTGQKSVLRMKEFEQKSKSFFFF